MLQQENEEAKHREEKMEAQIEKLAAAHQRDRDELNSLLAQRLVLDNHQQVRANPLLHYRDDHLRSSCSKRFGPGRTRSR